MRFSIPDRPQDPLGDQVLKLATRIKVESLGSLIEFRVEGTYGLSDGASLDEVDDLAMSLTRLAIQKRREEADRRDENEY